MNAKHCQSHGTMVARFDAWVIRRHPGGLPHTITPLNKPAVPAFATQLLILNEPLEQ